MCARNYRFCGGKMEKVMQRRRLAVSRDFVVWLAMEEQSNLLTTPTWELVETEFPFKFRVNYHLKV